MSVVVVFVFNIPPTAKVIWRRGHDLVSSNRLVKPAIEPVTPGLQGKQFIHYTTVAPIRVFDLRLTSCPTKGCDCLI